MRKKHLTLVFEIDESKIDLFTAFHKKMFPSTKEETLKTREEIGATVVASSWNDLYRENMVLEELYGAAFGLLPSDKQSILDIMEAKKCSYEKAEAIYNDEES